jgi:putative ABC transport system substrate-binding protein
MHFHTAAAGCHATGARCSANLRSLLRYSQCDPGDRMRRRHIAVLAAALVLTVPTRLAAQRLQSARVGVLHDDVRSAPFDTMFKRLGDLGWVEGRNLKVEFLTLDPELKQLTAKVKELVRLKCDVILATGTPAAMAVKANAPATPMVFIIGGDPVSLGLVASLSKPGGNATGYMQGSYEIILKQFSLLRDLAPTAKRIAVMFEAGNPSMMQGVQALQAAAGGLGIAVVPIALRDWKDVDAAYLKLTGESVGGLLVMLDRVTANNVGYIVRTANRLRLPAVYGSRYFSDFGAAVSYGIDWNALVVLGADYVARILGGAKPADLPVQQVSQFELIVNLLAARSQGLSVPQSVLLQATEVIR